MICPSTIDCSLVRRITLLGSQSLSYLARLASESTRPRRPQRQEEDHAAADGPDSPLAADDGEGEGFLVGLGQSLVVDFAYLALGGVGAGALGDEGDGEGEDAVEVVEAFLRLVVGGGGGAAGGGLGGERDRGGARP